MLKKLLGAGVILSLVAVMLVAGAATPAAAQSMSLCQTVDALVLAGVIAPDKVAAAKAAAGCSAAVAPAGAYTFTRNLTIGSTGADVTALQNFLLSNGNTIPAGATGYFGAQTKDALAAYQAAKGISPASGYFGPLTMASINANSVVVVPASTVDGCAAGAMFSATTGAPCTASVVPGCAAGAMFSATTGASCTGGTTPATGALMGGAGSVSAYKLLSSPTNNQEVGESQDDVKVIGVSVEADDGSDLKLTAVKVAFAQGTADRKLYKYADEVSVWLGNTELARVDAADFTSDNSYSKTISLSGNPVIKAGAIGNVYVKVSGISNIDSADIGETWTVDLTSVRFTDAQGASTSEDPSTAARTFSFESFATASNIELKLTEASSNPDSQVVEVDASNSTDDVVLLKTNLKATGDDILVNEITVTIDSTGSDVDEIASAYDLVIDGDVVQSLDAADCDDGTCDTSEAYTFDNVDYTVDAGTTVVVEVRAKINGTDDYNEGDTLMATMDIDDADAEDSSGETLGASDLAGVITGNEQAFYSEGIKLSFVSATAAVTAASDPAVNNDKVTFTLKFKATAFGGDAYVDGTLTEDGDGTYAAGSGVNYYVVDGSGVASTNTSTPVLTASNATASANSTWKVVDGQTATFTLTVVTEADVATEFAKISLSAVTWDTTAIAATTQAYTFNLDDFDSDPAYIVNNI